MSSVNAATVLASVGLEILVIVCEPADPFVMPTTGLLRLACRFTYPLADALMVQTHAVAAKYASSGLTLRRVHVIPNPVSGQILDIQQHAGIGNKKRLVSVGRLIEQKQFDVLIKVFASLARRRANWALRIVGAGPLRPLLQRQIIKLGLEMRVALPERTENIGEELTETDAFC